MSSAVKRACDSCHRRKVKCDGNNPCRNCGTAQLTCTYNAIPQKKGPKGSRAKVISELRETQRLTSLSAKVHNVLTGSAPDGPPSATMSLKGTPGLLTMETIRPAMDFYFDHLYALVPILDQQRLLHEARLMDQNQSTDTYCLLSSMTAYTMIQPGAPLPGGENGFNIASIPGAQLTATQILLEETVRVRKGIDYIMNPSLNSLCTSYFLFAAYYSLEDHSQAWFCLREAMTILLIHKLDVEDTYCRYDRVEASRRRRLFWLYFVAERVFAVKQGNSRPLTLQPSINLPTMSDDPTDARGHTLGNFLTLVQVFHCFDHAFMSEFNSFRASIDPHTVSTLQREHKNTQSNCNINSLIWDHEAWLRHIEWRLRCQSGRSDENEQMANIAFALSQDYSPEVMSLRSLFSTQFSAGADDTDRLEAGKIPPPGPHVTRLQEHLEDLLQVISALRNGDQRSLAFLIYELHDLIPWLLTPRLEEVPESPVAIYKSYGDLEMAVSPENSTKKYVADMGTTSAIVMNGATPDLTCPFPPPIISPALDYARPLHDFNAPLHMMNSLTANSAVPRSADINSQMLAHSRSCMCVAI